MIFGLKSFLFIFFLLFSNFSSSSPSNDKCRGLFTGSLRLAQTDAATRSLRPLPEFRTITEEIALSKHWMRQPTTGMKALTRFLPKDVGFINHALRESHSKHLVKFHEGGHSVIVRAGYESQGKSLETNVTLTDYGLINNPSQNKKWLIGGHAAGGVLFLHGGGTKSTGGHVAQTLINHFRKYNVAVISPDLAWHGEGPRTIMGSLDQEITALSDFVKKYVHPSVPLFVWGHSWGGSLAHRIMQMSGEQEKGFFHRHLKGLIISSPAIDPAPGKSIEDKKQAYIERRTAALNDKRDLISPHDEGIFTSMVLDGKTSPVGEFFSSLTISQLNDTLPDHQGRNYLPALMIVGVGDPLVYVGFEDLFHEYYDPLENVEAHYLENLPLLQNRKMERVGHLLSDYVDSPQSHTPVNFKLGTDFIAKLVPEVQRNTENYMDPPLLSILKLYSNDLAFREWLKTAEVIEITAREGGTLKKLLNNELINVDETRNDLLIDFHPFVWLLKDLKRVLELEPNTEGWIRLSNSDNLNKYKKQLEKFKDLIPHKSYPEFLSEIEGVTKLPRLQQTIESFLEKNIFSKLGSKTKRAFLTKTEALMEANRWDDFSAEFFYMPKEMQDKIKDLSKQSTVLNEKIEEFYIPLPEEFTSLHSNNEKIIEKIKRLGSLNVQEREKLEEEEADINEMIETLGKEINKNKERIKVNIKKIRHNVQERKKLHERKLELKKEIADLKREINKNMNEILKYIRLVRETFEQANLTPPEILKSLYEESEKEFSKLYKLSQALSDEIEAEAFQAIKNQDFTVETIEGGMNKHKNKITEFFDRYNDFISKRKEIRQKLIASARNRGLTPEQAEIFNSLYGDAGIYKNTDDASFKLAKREAELEKISKKEALLLENYQKLLPISSPSIVIIQPASNILNNNSFQDYNNSHDRLFQQILKKWKSLGSFTLPPLPE